MDKPSAYAKLSGRIITAVPPNEGELFEEHIRVLPCYIGRTNDDRSANRVNLGEHPTLSR
jgi:hypothetical protein